MNNKNDASAKCYRVLEIYSRLIAGKVIRKQELAEEFGVTPRSIQRDIDTVRDFYSNQTVSNGETAEIKYDRSAKGFRISSTKTVMLTNAELFSVAKILLESRSLNKQEMEKIVHDLIDACLPSPERKKMADLVRNEMFHYVEPRHGKGLVDIVWNLGTAVYAHQMVELHYKKVNDDVTTAIVKPVGIMESEFYFYLIAYIGDHDKKYPGYPTIYRMDRILKYRIINENFFVPDRDRFEEGLFRKRIAFMYGGPLTKTKFIYKGPDINAVLDKLPASTYEILEDGSYRVQAETYGNKGIEMWLGSQNEWVVREVLK